MLVCNCNDNKVSNRIVTINNWITNDQHIFEKYVNCLSQPILIALAKNPTRLNQHINPAKQLLLIHIKQICYAHGFFQCCNYIQFNLSLLPHKIIVAMILHYIYIIIIFN